MVLLSPSLPSQHRAGKWTRYPSCPVATSRQFSLSPPKILSCNPDKNHKAWVSHHMGSDRGNMHRELATSSMGPGECPRHFQSKASLWIGWDLQEIHHLLHPASVWLKVSEEEPTTMLTEKAFISVTIHSIALWPSATFSFLSFSFFPRKLFKTLYLLLPIAPSPSAFSDNQVASHFTGKMRGKSRKLHKSHHPSPMFLQKITSTSLF